MENINNILTPETPIQSNKKPNIFKYLFFACFFLLLAVIICFLFILNNKISKLTSVQQDSSNISQITPTVTVTPTITVSETMLSTTSPDGSVECYQNGKYFVALKNSQSENSRLLVKSKINGNSYNDCSYNYEKSDFETVGWISQILDLNNDFLLTDSGTGPGVRGLSFYNLDKKLEIYTGSYVGGGNIPLKILDNNTFSFWEETSTIATEKNCPNFAETKSYGLTSAIDQHVVLNLITLKKDLLDEYRCSSRQ